MKDYSSMSDFEINMKVGEIMFPGDQCQTPYNHRPDVQVFHKNNCNSFFDFCNSWADAGPIIEGNRITLTSLIDGSAWDAMTMLAEMEFKHENPLRAAMIVFLMMKDAESNA